MPTSTEIPELSIVIPCFQEAARIAHSLETIAQSVASLTATFEILAVDDGSTDGTWAELLSLHQAFPHIRALRLSRNFGKEYAIAAGLARARGAAVVIMDADLQHPPELISRFYQLWKSGEAQIVEGVKNSRRAEPWTARVTSRAFNALFAFLSGQRFSGNSDFKLLDRQAVDTLNRMGERRWFFRGVASTIGFRRVEIPFDVGPRRPERSTWTLWLRLRLAGRAIVSYSAAPLRLIHVFALLFLVFSIWLGAQALYLKFTARAVDGFTTVIILLLMIGGLLLLALGVIAEYLAAIYEEVKGRPRYILSDSTDDAAALPFGGENNT